MQKLVATLGQARIPFALDFSFGDPGQVGISELESVVDHPAVELRAYPLTLNLAEKIVTAMQRREVSTRDRDFADLWVTSRRHRLNAAELRGDVLAVADHRRQPIITMAVALANMPDRQQPYAAMVTRMSYLSPPGEQNSMELSVHQRPTVHSTVSCTALPSDQALRDALRPG